MLMQDILLMTSNVEDLQKIFLVDDLINIYLEFLNNQILNNALNVIFK